MKKKNNTPAELIKNMVEKMGFAVELEILEEENSSTINILSEYSSLLIGRGGENLIALQQIANLLIFSKNPENDKRIFLDVNNYRQKQKIYLIDLAQKTMQKVQRSGRPEVLCPMSASERKTIHLEMAKNPSIMTESIGEEPNRRIVVKIKK